MLVRRVRNILRLGNKLLRSIEGAQDYIDDRVGFTQLTHEGLALLNDVYGPDDFRTTEFSRYDEMRGYVLQEKMGMLKAVCSDIEGGWYQRTRGLIAGELFDDFLDMAAHLLDQKYKDAAAVIAGTALETHLRRLCGHWGVTATKPDGKPKPADLLNADLQKASAYTPSEQKQVTAWMGIRNDAAHGDYEKVISESVRLMIEGIRHFVSIHPA
jgi:hypothetical protein